MNFDDKQIAEIANLFDCTFEEADVAFLKTASSCEVHACPGSGKTTLLVAKLALLARQWTWRDRGILVLSHTNVARSEVERRLARDASASHLLVHPHFVGTIQSFVDRYLALPYLRDVGPGCGPVGECRIDDALFAAQAWKRFKMQGWKDYKQANAYLDKKSGQGANLVQTLSYTAEGGITSEEGDLPSADKPSGRQLRALKDTLSQQGIFRYADMFAFAAASIKRHSYLSAAIQGRFPWVFIDEMQDTDEAQEKLLGQVFSDRCIVQKLGDKNQAIFRGDRGASNGFASGLGLDLPRSHRLSPTIAAAASRMTAVHEQTIVGNAKRCDRAHTIFLFDDSAIASVLPAYGDLLLREWGDALTSGLVAKAVGLRRSRTTSSKRPSRISDYWANFPEGVGSQQAPQRTFVETVEWSRTQVLISREYHPAHRAVLDAMRHIVECSEGGRVSRYHFQERMRDGRLNELRIRKSVARLLCGNPLTADTWPKAMNHLRGLLLPAGSLANPQLDAFLALAPAANTSTTLSATSGSNIYRHTAGDRAVDIHVATIHSVKGETHDATLVLETLSQDHDLKTVLPHLCAKARAPKLSKREIVHMKHIFVAMTRPRELLCFALHTSHTTMEQLAALQAVGWQIQVLG